MIASLQTEGMHLNGLTYCSNANYTIP